MLLPLLAPVCPPPWQCKQNLGRFSRGCEDFFTVLTVTVHADTLTRSTYTLDSSCVAVPNQASPLSPSWSTVPQQWERSAELGVAG